MLTLRFRRAPETNCSGMKRLSPLDTARFPMSESSWSWACPGAQRSPRTGACSGMCPTHPIGTAPASRCPSGRRQPLWWRRQPGGAVPHQGERRRHAGFQHRVGEYEGRTAAQRGAAPLRICDPTPTHRGTLLQRVHRGTTRGAHWGRGTCERALSLWQQGPCRKSR
jgi:hypothetical protein